MKAVTITFLLLCPMTRAYCRRGYKYCGSVLKYIQASQEVLDYYGQQVAAQSDGMDTLFGCNFGSVVPLLHCQYGCHDAGPGNNDYCCASPKGVVELSRDVRECNSHDP
ncbi:hypothetical protein GQ602_004423 [Ophiocordyceps camponoti-floridani]|uniref:Hydrophobin n=1 Tax=Ophiocordyceps camponoti-floridani TaxID=2030778 RepID=A0A8H4Q6V8_9HYPO|nr:hypothetical protein GQ602_004423 [Ophiocordyceps camponoti-floridani]